MKEQFEGYRNSTSFIRDFFQYLIPGAIWIILVLIIYQKPITIPFNEAGSSDIILKNSFFLLFVSAIFSYIIGLLGNSVSKYTFIVMRLLLCWSSAIRELRKVESTMNEVANIYSSKINSSVENEGDLQVRLLYTSLFLKVPNVYNIRVERYNNLTMLWRSLSGLSIFTPVPMLIFDYNFLFVC